MSNEVNHPDDSLRFTADGEILDLSGMVSKPTNKSYSPAIKEAMKKADFSGHDFSKLFEGLGDK